MASSLCFFFITICTNGRWSRLIYVLIYFKKVYVLPAPSIVAAVALRKLRKIETDGADVLTKNLQKYHAYELVKMSIEN